MCDNSENPARNDCTAGMRDQQARGKDPYDEQEDEHDNKHFISQKQQHAAQMLNSPESLMNEAQRTSDVSRAANVLHAGQQLT